MVVKLEFPHKCNILKNIPLSEYTNIKIGGKTDYLALVNDQNAFVELFNFCLQNDIRFLAIGHGTNVLFSDNGFRGLVAVVKFDKIQAITANSIIAESGASLLEINKICIDNSLTGFEFTSGIPGTVGGAIFGNAGAYGKSVGNYLTKAKILTSDGKIKFIDHDYFKFSYRYSELKKSNAIVIEAEFQLQKGDPTKIREKVEEILDQRCKKLPNSKVLTAGSYFKNVKDKYGNQTAAAFYLDAVGSKRTSVGDAGVYHKHANIFSNNGHATAKDILELEDILKIRVFDKFGIKLEREVVYIE